MLATAHNIRSILLLIEGFYQVHDIDLSVYLSPPQKKFK